MFTFQSDISAKDFDAFAYHHPYGSIFQSSGWAACKSNWESHYCVALQDNVPVAGSLVLIRTFKGISFAYMPRGPLFSEDEEANHFFIKELKAFLSRHKVVLAKADPHRIIRYLSFEESEAVPNIQSKELEQYYASYGFKHKGYPLAIADSIQPRIQLSYPIDPVNPTERIPHKTQKKIRASYRKGVIVKEEHDAGNLAKMVEKTEARHSIHLRNEDYFNAILNAFKENAVVLSTYDEEGHLLASGLIVMSEKEAEILYSGYDDQYKHFNSTYVLRNEAILFAARNGKERFNFGGVEGTLDDGLTEFKRSFNPEIAVYIGEFDLMTMPVLSSIASEAFNTLKHRISL